MAAPAEFRAVWPNQPATLRVRLFPSLERLQAYVSDVLAVAARNQFDLSVTCVTPTEARIEKSPNVRAS